MILFILCGLALLAATIGYILFYQEKKRNEKRRAAMIELIYREDGTLAKQLDELCKEYQEKLNTLENRVDGLRNMYGARFEEYDSRLNTLEKGVVPDYEKARQAVDEVNKFNEGLSNMLGFDPMESLKRARNNPGGDR